jgi:hypothetical protein
VDPHLIVIGFQIASATVWLASGVVLLLGLSLVLSIWLAVASATAWLVAEAIDLWAHWHRPTPR